MVTKCISCLAGSVDKGVVEVTNCFCVPHKEHDDQVEAELSYALDLYDLNRKVNSNENVVGELDITLQSTNLLMVVITADRLVGYWQ